ncbi:MAG: hemerythrin domain-containing protein [Actinomycetota bacterium]
MATRRHDALMPLTHDHHHALAQARLLRQAGKLDQSERLERARAFVDFFERDTVLHFREEEEGLLPLLADHVEERDILLQILAEHLEIHRRVHGLRRGLAAGDVTGEDLVGLGELLAGHVRLEEKKLFPLAETAIPEEVLAEMALAERDRGTPP